MADRNTARRTGEILDLKVAASTSIDAGKKVAINAAGFAVAAADAAGLKVTGVSQEAVDNSSGADGDITVRVLRKKAWLFANDGTNAVAQAHLLTNIYVKDDATVSSDGGTNSIVAGLCIGIESAGVWVEI